MNIFALLQHYYHYHHCYDCLHNVATVAAAALNELLEYDDFVDDDDGGDPGHKLRRGATWQHNTELSTSICCAQQKHNMTHAIRISTSCICDFVCPLACPLWNIAN